MSMEHTPEIRTPEGQEEQPRDIPAVVPGIAEIPEEPDTGKGKKQPDISPEERQKIIDDIIKEEEAEDRHRQEVEEIIKKRDQQKPA